MAACKRPECGIVEQLQWCDGLLEILRQYIAGWNSIDEQLEHLISNAALVPKGALTQLLIQGLRHIYGYRLGGHDTPQTWPKARASQHLASLNGTIAMYCIA